MEEGEEGEEEEEEDAFDVLAEMMSEMFAVKQVNILDKPRRDQVVAELRIMMTHTQSPWLVTLYK